MFHNLASATVLLAIWLTSLIAAQTTQKLRNVQVGDPVPAFSIQTLDGQTMEKPQYKGKVLLLLFVMPEQGASRKTMEVAQAVLKDNQDTELAVLAVSAQPKAGDYFMRLAAELQLSYPIAMDPERKMYGDFGLLVTPTTLLIDKAGVLRFELPHLPPGYESSLRIHADLLLGKIGPQEHDALLAKAGENLEQADDTFERRLAMARSLVEQRAYGRAIPVLLELRAEEGSLFVEILLGTCYLGVDNVEEAAEHLDPLADRQPAPPVLKYALGCLESRRGDDQKAEAYLLDALRVSPNKGAIQFELGRIYERQGQLEKALECYRAALEGIYR